jgi:hypothetical protein
MPVARGYSPNLESLAPSRCGAGKVMRGLLLHDAGTAKWGIEAPDELNELKT